MINVIENKINQYAIELNAGDASRIGLQVGLKLNF